MHARKSNNYTNLETLSRICASIDSITNFAIRSFCKETSNSSWLESRLSWFYQQNVEKEAIIKTWFQWNSVNKISSLVFRYWLVENVPQKVPQPIYSKISRAKLRYCQCIVVRRVILVKNALECSSASIKIGSRAIQRILIWVSKIPLIVLEYPSNIHCLYFKFILLVISLLIYYLILSCMQ